MIGGGRRRGDGKGLYLFEKVAGKTAWSFSASRKKWEERNRNESGIGEG